MTTYLRIENPGVCPVEGFTLLGASTSRGSENSGVIGQFGSGNKHGVAVCLRYGLKPVIFCGTRRLDFSTRSQHISDGIDSKKFARIVVKHSGKDDIKTYNFDEELGFVLEYGAIDWPSISMALREFVSNALDRCYKEHSQMHWNIFTRKNNITTQLEADQKSKDFWTEYNAKAIEPWKMCNIDVVEENQVRAKKDTTRVFVPLHDEAIDFYKNLGKWFLHFSEPDMLKKTLMPKRNRNLEKGREVAVIYRKGVRVREFEQGNTQSLFDYNLDNLCIDESRQVNDYTITGECASALKYASAEDIGQVLHSFRGQIKYWEHGFDYYHLICGWDDEKKKKELQENWGQAAKAIDGSVLCTESEQILVRNKGLKPLVVPEAYVKAADSHNLPTISKILTQDERDGRHVFAATPVAQTIVSYMWDILEANRQTNNKTQPTVYCFTESMKGDGKRLFGFYRDKAVYLNTAYIPAEIESIANVADDLLATVLEELAHYITDAKDNERGFQDYAFGLAIVMMRQAVDFSQKIFDDSANTLESNA